MCQLYLILLGRDATAMARVCTDAWSDHERSSARLVVASLPGGPGPAAAMLESDSTKVLHDVIKNWWIKHATMFTVMLVYYFARWIF